MIWLTAAIVASAIVGVWAERRFEDGARDLADRFLSFGLWVVLPVLGFINLNVLELDADVGAGIAFGWCALAGCALTAYVAGRFVLRLPRPAIGGMILSGSWGNTGYLGLPLTIGVFGSAALPNAVAYDILVSGLTFVTAGFAIAAAFGNVGTSVGERVRAFLLRNPPLWAAVAALLLPHGLVPDWLADGSHALVILIVPLGFFAVGVTLASVAEEGAAAFPPPLTAPLAVAVTAKCVVSPAIVFGLSTLLLDVPDPYITQAAVGSNLSSLAVAQIYGLDRGIVAGTIAVTTTITLAWGLAVSLL